MVEGDFESRKRIFKACADTVGNLPEGATWADIHVYTVNYFLPFMEQQGYSLVRTRQDARPLAETLKGCEKHMAATFAQPNRDL